MESRSSRSLGGPETATSRKSGAGTALRQLQSASNGSVHDGKVRDVAWGFNGPTQDASQAPRGLRGCFIRCHLLSWPPWSVQFSPPLMVGYRMLAEKAEGVSEVTPGFTFAFTPVRLVRNSATSQHRRGSEQDGSLLTYVRTCPDRRRPELQRGSLRSLSLHSA